MSNTDYIMIDENGNEHVIDPKKLDQHMLEIAELTKTIRKCCLGSVLYYIHHALFNVLIDSIKRANSSEKVEILDTFCQQIEAYKSTILKGK